MAHGVKPLIESVFCLHGVSVARLDGDEAPDLLILRGEGPTIVSVALSEAARLPVTDDILTRPAENRQKLLGMAVDDLMAIATWMSPY